MFIRESQNLLCTNNVKLLLLTRTAASMHNTCLFDNSTWTDLPFRSRIAAPAVALLLPSLPEYLA